jgi:hypothetical protein
MIEQSKSMLARLLAQENLTVIHKQVSTAYFELTSRTLVCPIFEDMVGELYDLLVGHEVGHALYTPPEGWHNALEKKGMGFKSYLNIVEDARIEKRMKATFPGLRKSFSLAYKILVDRNFFGTNNINDINSLPLIDRINLSFKCGALMNVKFSEKETPLVDRVASADTWEDVVAVATDLYDFAKKEETHLNLEDLHHMMVSIKDCDDDLEDLIEAEDGDLNAEDAEDLLPVKSSKKGSQSTNFDEKRPESLTDKIFREKEKSLVEKDSSEIVSVFLPKFNMDKRIISHQEIYSLRTMKDEINEEDVIPIKANFLKKNSKYISFLVKEFLLKKNASMNARAQVNKTGKIDMNKIDRYKFTNDIFLRVTTVPKGQSHGMVMFLDMSHSMSNIFGHCLEQIMILSTFCRKVNIPFEVYGFTEIPKRNEKEVVEPLQRSTTAIARELVSGNVNFFLLQLLSSTMNFREYTKAINYLLLIKNSFYYEFSTSKRFIRPAIFELHGTPLNECIVAGIDLVNNFRKKNRLEKVSSIFITDGEAAQWSYFWEKREDGSDGVVAKNFSYYYKSSVLNVIDPKSKISVMYRGSKYGKIQSTPTYPLLGLFKKLTESTVIGFFLAGRSPYSAIKDKTGLDPTPAQLRYYKQEKFLPLEGPGYDKFYVVSSDSLRIAERGYTFDVNASKSVKVKEFTKKLKARRINRIFLTKFVEEIA